jgi:hypothetical protein
MTITQSHTISIWDLTISGDDAEVVDECALPRIECSSSRCGKHDWFVGNAARAWHFPNHGFVNVVIIERSSRANEVISRGRKCNVAEIADVVICGGT